MYYYGNGYQGMPNQGYGTPYYQPYYGGSNSGIWAFALVIFILLIVVGCYCSRPMLYR